MEHSDDAGECKTPPPEDALALGPLFKALLLMSDVLGSIPIRQAALLLNVAIYPDRKVSTLANMSDISESETSRYLLALGPRRRSGQEGLDLVERCSELQDQRVKLVRLTKKGKQFICRLVMSMDLGIEKPP